MMPEVPINANISWFATKPKCIRDSSNVYWVWLDLAEVSALKKGPKKHVQKEPLREHFFWQRKLPKHWNLTIMYISRREIKWRNSDHNILLWIDLSVNCESPVRSMGGVLRILWCILWSLCICYSKLHPHYLRRPGALFFSSLLPSSTINTISKGNLYSFICTPKRGTEGFIGQSKRFISFGPTTGDVHCTIPVRKRFQSRISNLFQTS